MPHIIAKENLRGNDLRESISSICLDPVLRVRVLSVSPLSEISIRLLF